MMIWGSANPYLPCTLSERYISHIRTLHMQCKRVSKMVVEPQFLRDRDQASEARNKLLEFIRVDAVMAKGKPP